jgi:hypothetical protein
MSLPYFMLSDTPELNRDALLDRLQKRLATAEGLPAQLRLPMWDRGQQSLSALSAKYAFPTSMQFESIPESYWYEAKSGRVEVVFNQNVVFCGDQGYLHVRVLKQEDEGLTSTGMPGRPSKGKDLINAEFQRRVSANECEQTLDAQAQE